MKFNQISLLIFICVLFGYGVLIIYRYRSPNIKSSDAFFYSENDTYCPIPIFNDVKLHFQPTDMDCKSEFSDWIYIFNNYAIFNSTIYNEVGEFLCYYKEIRWNGDFHSLENSEWNWLLNYTYMDNKLLKVICKAKGIFNYNEQYLIGFNDKYSTEIHDNPNIIIIGIDSISRLAWKRLLSASYNYMKNKMINSSVIFKKVNVRGDGTTINILAILTGEEETELYESRRNEPGAKPVDNYPWIWNILSKMKYTTFYDDEDTDFGTFQYRLLGFKNQPTDYYGRSWRLIHRLQKRNKLCMNRRNNFQFQLDSVEQFFTQIKGPKFAFMWSSHFSHNINENVINLDQDLLKFLKTFNQPTSIFNNTIFYLISDHGNRFSRNHLRGKYEERLPFLAVNIHQSIMNKHLQIINNMKSNENKLVTLFDAHESLLDIINNFSLNKTRYVYDIKKVSLFDSKMPYRNCKDVKVPPHWCVCLKLIEINSEKKDVIQSAKHAVKIINQYIEDYYSVCYQLQLDKVIRAHLIQPSDDVVRFHKSDKDGRKPDLSDNTLVENIYYRVLFKTKPGDALFESTVNVRNINSKSIFYVNIKDIDRNNRYADWIWCITQKMRDIRKFCLCR